jgi:hypothetical protein
MKYLSLMAIVGVVYFVIARQAPVTEVKQVVAQTEAAPLTLGSREPVLPATSSLKRPIARTTAVLDQVKARNGDGEF